MAVANTKILNITVTLSADAPVHRFVSPTGGRPAADGNTLGVAEYKADSGDEAAVTVLGTAVVEAGAAIAVGDPVKTDAAGKALKNADVANDVTVARALTAAAADGDLIEALLITN